MTEFSEHSALIKHARKQKDRFPELDKLITIPSEIGGYRSKFRGIVAKGVPDIVLPVRRMGFGGLWLELKHGKNKPTKEQYDFLGFLSEQRFLAAWAIDRYCAWELIAKYLLGNEIVLTEKMQYKGVSTCMAEESWDG